LHATQAGDGESVKRFTAAGELARALAMALFDEHRITSLFVVEDDGRGKKPVGVLHIHDCPAAR
jgi:arabinose-5-phosphate isomerase